MANGFTNEKYREKLKQLTLFDAILFRKVFDLNIPAAETLLRIIMENDKIKVTECKTEYTVTGLASHSVQLDLLAKDENGRFFNVEVQTDSSGAPPQRARYYSDAVDTGHFPKGEDYNNLFDTYVIFITKEDVLGKGLPIYHVKRTIDETGDAFNDGSYIIYVNGELTNDNTALGRLVHDFSCLHSKDIYDETLKECVKRYKETEEGIQTMCTVMEELRNEGIQQGMKQGKNLGMQKFAELTKQLLALGRTNDLSRATVDEEYRDKLFKELAIQ